MRNTTSIKTLTHKGTDLFKKNTKNEVVIIFKLTRKHIHRTFAISLPLSHCHQKLNETWFEKKVVLESNVFTRHRDCVLSIGRAICTANRMLLF